MWPSSPIFKSPLGLCFRDPDAIAGSSVTELLPPYLKKLTLMEVWWECTPFRLPIARRTGPR